VSRVEGEVAAEIVEADVGENLVVHLIIGSVLIGLRHFHMVVGNLDLSVVGEVGKIDVSVCGACRVDNVYLVLTCGIVTVAIGILEPVVVSALSMLRIDVPHGSGHCSVVGKGLKVLIVNVIRSDTVGLGASGGEVVVGSKELDGGQLLERILSPVLIEVKNGELLALARVGDHGESYLAVADIAPCVDGLLKLIGEVLGYLERDGEHHIVLIEDCRALNAGGKGVGKNVDASVLIVACDLEGNGAVLILLVVVALMEAYVFLYGEAIDTAKGIVSVKGGSGRLGLVDNDVLGGNGVTLELCLTNEFVKIV
jgi:hypothetical protein